MINKYPVKKYMLVALIFASIFVFGKNFDITSSSEKPLQEQIISLQKQLSDKKTIVGKQDFIEIGNKINTEQGEYYRIFYNLEVTNQSGQNKGEKVNLALSAQSYYNSQQIDNLKVDEGDKIYNREVTFKSNYRSTSLKLEKLSENYTGTVTISNIRYTHLLEDPKNLNSTVVGLAGDKVSISQGDSTETKHFFRKDSQVIGSIFESKSDTITGVDFKLNFIGSGGANNYMAVILSLDQNGIPKVSDPLSYYYFTKDIAEDYLKSGSDLYHFPLSAKVEKGKKYFIGVSNQYTKFNYFNTLSLLGTGNAGNIDQPSLSIVNGAIVNNIDDLYYRVYEPVSKQPNQDNILGNEIVQDVGNGQGLYEYVQSGLPRDILDINSVENGKKSDVYYDNNLDGIIGKAENNLAFIYKFDAIFPIERARISLGQVPQGIVDSLVYYSLDGENWKKIAVGRKDFNSTGNFSTAVEVSGNTNVIYLKITYDSTDTKYRAFQLFGIHALDIRMDLNL